MSSFTDARSEVAHPLAGGARGFIRWVCTNNPFYVFSAGLFIIGLWISFGDQSEAESTWALMTGLGGYTLLLAVTAGLLVRFGAVWDDVRTLLLMVVLMFLATSLTFDEVLVLDSGRGFACCLGGLLFAIAVSEGLLRSIRLALPAGFRIPYYLILSHFFLYPLALSPLLDKPKSEVLLWGLFGFSSVAGLLFLTLLPAIRRGPHYVSNNGSPWRWPLYPWALFGLLGCAVPARAFLLCWSMHLLFPAADRTRLIFGPYFLVPFGLAIAVLLLEIGLVSYRRGVLGTALAMPAGLVVLALIGHRSDPIYRGFFELFTARLGGDPLYLTLIASVAFYAYASLRRVPLATEALTGALAVLAMIGPDILNRRQFDAPHLTPILAAALLQLGLGLWQRASWRCLIGSLGLASVAMLALPAGGENTAIRAPTFFHLALLAVLIVGAAYAGKLAQVLRVVGAVLVMMACLAALSGRLEQRTHLPQWAIDAYPLVMALLLASYGLMLGHRFSLVITAVVLTGWLIVTGWRGYLTLRLLIVGLDYLALSLTLFVLAVLISLGKSGLLARWWGVRTRKMPLSAD